MQVPSTSTTPASAANDIERGVMANIFAQLMEPKGDDESDPDDPGDGIDVDVSAFTDEMNKLIAQEIAASLFPPTPKA